MIERRANLGIGLGRALRAAIAVALLGGTALVALCDWLGIGGAALASAANGPLFAAVILSAGIACLLRAHRSGPEGAAWLVIGITILVEAGSEIAWSAITADGSKPPYPSIADVGWLAFFPLATTGLILMIRARARSVDWQLWNDGLIAALGTAALGLAFVFEFIAEQATGTPLQRAVTLAYPLGDIFVLACVVGVIALTGWRPGRTWCLLLLGLVALVFADIASSLYSGGDEIVAPTWATPIYMLGALCIGIEALQPDEPIRSTRRNKGWQDLMVPALFAIVAISLFLIQYLRAASVLTAVISAATMLAIVARLTLSVIENKRLLKAVRTDSLTGLGNQGGLEADLAERCRHAAEEPATLLLLDLNGFKRFNDTFGHPAGDRMLARLGVKLRAVASGKGFAYRIGGDEFAVLVDGTRQDSESITRQAAEALTEKGDDYTISAAWGTVEIPAEATTAATAVQMADVRMYAQKQSRRLAWKTEPARSSEAIAVARPL